MELNVLILAYHFPPSNSSAAHRPDSWARHGKKYGLNPTVVTRHWEGLENEWLNFSGPSGQSVTVEKNDYAEIIRLPYRDHSHRDGEFWKQNRLTRKLYFVYQTLKGNFHTQANVMATYRPYLIELLQRRKFDCIIATAPPYQLIELAAELSSRFKIPFISDIRDLWNDNKALQVNARWTIRERFYESVSRYYTRKWIKHSSLVTAVAAPLGEAAIQGLLVPYTIITNGYEAATFAEAKPRKVDAFTVTLTGTVYPEQKFDVLLQGFRKFLEQRPKAKLHFVGVSIIPGMEQRIKAILPEAFVNVQPRVSKKEAIDLIVSSHVLFYVGWQGYRGFYTGKIFEYLAARKNILIAPGDNDVIDALLLESNAGVSANSPEEVETVLKNWYLEWLATGQLTYNGREEVIKKYSREEQTHKLATEIQKIDAKKRTRP